EAWASLAQLLGRNGRRLANGHGSWPEVVPSGLSEHDPWVLLAQARRKVALGRLPEAVGAYDQAGQLFGSTSVAQICRRERQAVSLWLEASPAPRVDWMCLLRAATQRDPLSVAHEAARLPGATGRFTVAVATLLGGHVEEARRVLSAVNEHPDVPPVLSIVARLLATVLDVAMGRRASERLADLHDDVEALDVPWLTRLCRSMAVLLNTRNSEAAVTRISDRHDGDAWGATLVSFLDGVLRVWDGRPAVAAFEDAALGFRGLGAGVAETWARSGLALAMAREGHPESRQAAVAAVRCARSCGVPGAEAPALLALGIVAGERGSEYLDLARTLAEQGGIPLPPPSSGAVSRRNGTSTAPAAPAPPPLTLRCFGGFALHLADRVVDPRGLKPRPRAALHLLALNAGRAVHRETLLEALWPEVDAGTGMRNLHVAVSTIRRFLEPDGGRGKASLVLRDADSYRLDLPTEAAVDLWVFEVALAEGRAAQAAGRLGVAVEALERALDTYRGDLLPEAGPADWVVMARERYRLQASEASLLLTELHLHQGEPRRAVTVAERGLAIDRYRDAQWRRLIAACEMAGDRAAAARVRRSYDEMLGELGLAPSGS
ncbi:MAG: hypothetical protein QOI86_5386, partial [Actinomycetota bacterium]|nr:hypothetical protein [Actinomycetota bacterium]